MKIGFILKQKFPFKNIYGSIFGGTIYWFMIPLNIYRVEIYTH